jgi:phage terminase large subunit-like protein
LTAVAIREDLQPFTVEHFEAWIDECEIKLDTGDDWELEPFHRMLLADILSPIREVWVIIPEGNTKTTLMAGVALYCGDHTHRPWIPIGAASRDQAEIMFGQAAIFVEGSDVLKQRFRVFEGYRRIKCLRTGGRGIRVYAADTKTGDGVIPTDAFVDELHRHDDLKLYRLWKGKLGKRQGRIRTISTAGEPGTPFEEMRETIRGAAIKRDYEGSHLRAEGKSLIYHEWMLRDPEEARNLEIVKAVNPFSGITLEYLDEKLSSETLDFGEDWLRLTCNIATRSSQAAIPEADWDACQTDLQIPEGTRIGVGVDPAFAVDTFAIVPLWMKSQEERIFGDPEILVPPRDGTLLPLDEVHAAFRRIHDRTPIEVVVMDTSQAKEIAQWLSDEMGLTVVDRSQKNTEQANDYDLFMPAIRQRWLKHTGHPVFRRHALNAIRRQLEGERLRFDRPSTSRNTRAGRQERRVIDALVAAAMVHSFMAEAPPPGEVTLAFT